MMQNKLKRVRRDKMANKELSKLNRKELLQMLLVQCEETERMQKETEKVKAAMAAMEESYERLKAKLNVKDERLNEKDAKIAELKSTIEDMKAKREIELDEAGSIAEAALRLNDIFESAQRCADQYLENVRRLCEKEKQTSYESGWQQSARRRTNLSAIKREFTPASRPVRNGTDETIVRIQKENKPLPSPGDIYE